MVLSSSQELFEALIVLLDNISNKFCYNVYRQILSLPKGTNCVPFVADLFSFCYERDFMLCLSDDNQSEVIENTSLPRPFGN